MKSSGIPKRIDPGKIRIAMVCEAPPEDERDYFYSGGHSMYVTNTIQAFRSAGIEVDGISEILGKGVYLTVAVRIPREGNVVPSGVIEEHSYTLEEELDSLPDLKAILLMGDTAIRSLNCISQRTTEGRVIPAGSTYKLRGGEYFFKGIRVFPSYLQTGKNFLIEKSKQKMVVEDIRNAFEIAGC